jgi:hypothetical protein
MIQKNFIQLITDPAYKERAMKGLYSQYYLLTKLIAPSWN